ncbi:hypothetical protein HK096_008103, partial [Nowakowskiella sp. JEL0078]
MFPSAHCFFVEGSRFGMIDNSEFCHLKYSHLKEHQKINLNGKFVVPGLIDAHGHLMGLGQSLKIVDLKNCQNTSEVRFRLREFIEKREESDRNLWLLGHGWDQTKWSNDDGFPTYNDLDSDPILSKFHISLSRIDYHALWVNSKVIQALNLPPNPKPIEGGKIITGSEGNPTGIFMDNAIQLITIYPERDEKENIQTVNDAVDHLLEFGLTTIQDAGVFPAELRILQKIFQHSIRKIRNYAMVLCLDDTQYCGDQVPKELILKDGASIDGRFLMVRSVKMMLDGALGSWGAAMIEPYSDKPNITGLLRHDPLKLKELVWKWTQNEFQVCIHAIGDLANRIVVDIFEETISIWKTKFSEKPSLRLRIEHAQIMQHQSLIKIGQSNGSILPSVQPTHCTSDMFYAEKRLGISRLNGSYMWKSFLNVGVAHLPFGSDFPVESANPLLGIYAAVTRLSNEGTSPNGTSGWYPQEKVSITQALKGFTIDAAYAAYLENEIGSIETGKLADFSVFTTNFFEATMDGHPEEILKSKCDAVKQEKMGPKKNAVVEKPLLGRPSNNLKMGIVGLPNVGKSSFFNALTNSSAPAENFPFCTIDPEESRVAVPDARFDWLCDFYKPSSKVPAYLTVIDIAGLVKGAHEGQGLGNAFLSHIKAVDGIFHLCRAFEDSDITHVEGDLDPVRDLQIIHEELRLKDEDFIEKLVASREREVARLGSGGNAQDKVKKEEFEILKKIQKWVSEDKKDVREGDWSGREIEFINTMYLLTAKP